MADFNQNPILSPLVAQLQVRQRPGYVAPTKGATATTKATSKLQRPIATLPEPCDKPNRILGAGPQIFWTTQSSQGVGGATKDIYVLLPYLCRVFIVASIKTPQNSVFFHLKPLGKNYAGGNPIVADGTEQWFALTAQPVATAAPYFFTKLKFKNGIQEFYLDMGQENGAANTITIACLADDDAVDVVGGPYT